MAIATGHGVHLLWRLAEKTAPALLSELVADLAALLHSDSSVKNPERVLRLPGFQNWKKPVAESRLLFADPARRYAVALLRAAVPAAVAERPALAPDAPQGAPARTGGNSEAVAHVLERARKYLATIPGAVKGGRSAAAFRVAAILRNDFRLPDASAWPLLCEWNQRNAPPLDERELRAVFQSGGKYAKHARGAKADAPRKAPAHSGGSEPARVIISAAAGDGDLTDMRAELAAQRDGTRRTLALPWKRLDNLSHFLRPGTVGILGGPTGTGKTFFNAHIALAVQAAEVPWRFLPLEDRKVDFFWRLLAILAGDYRMIEDGAEGAAWRQENLDRFAAPLEDLMPFIAENPRVGCKGADGKTFVPALPYGAVLDWIAAACEQSARVLFVDPLSQIDFEGREPWKAEAEFIRKALALMADAGATLILTCHTVKRGGKSATLPLSVEDLQGSAMIARLCHTVLLLDSHDAKTSTVYRAGGLREDVEHNRTLLVAKARNASGTRQRIAFTQRSDAPVFDEHGVIAPRGAPDSEAGEHWANG
ncbi:MAG: AAA family ATPase [Candidatus Brocadiia bacterium]